MDDESVILVDSGDNVLGHAPKEASHDGDGRLHRAFSVFLFNQRGEVLLQQRSEKKRLWPLYWANSCCSHPRRGEAVLDAGQRRIREELDARSDLRFIYKFEYRARFGGAGSEHELCYVYLGRLEGDVRPNRDEIAAYRFVAPAELDRELVATPDVFTPWLKLEWRALNGEHAGVLSDFRQRL